MKQLLRVLALAVVAALAVPALHPVPVTASPVDQQRARVEQIVDELERLEEQANQLAEDYVVALDEKAALDEEIVEAEARVAAKEAELEELRGDLGEMAVRSFVGGGTSPLGPLFEDTSDLTDVMQREELARVALSAGTVTTDELDEAVKELEAERRQLEDKRDQAAQLAEQLQVQQEATEERTAEYTAARAEAEAELGRLIAEEEARRARESAARIAAEAEAAAQASSGGGGGGGGGGGTAPGTNTATPSSGDDGGGGGGGAASTPAAAAPAPAVSSRSGIAVNAAMGQQGVPYRFATSNPGVSFDCSGLTKYAWGQAGVYLPHQSRQQYASIPHVSKSAAQPGDLIFFYNPISHVGIYIGGGQMVHAPNTGSVVSVTGVNWGRVTGVGRPG